MLVIACAARDGWAHKICDVSANTDFPNLYCNLAADMQLSVHWARGGDGGVSIDSSVSVHISFHAIMTSNIMWLYLGNGSQYAHRHNAN